MTDRQRGVLNSPLFIFYVNNTISCISWDYLLQYGDEVGGARSMNDGSRNLRKAAQKMPVDGVQDREYREYEKKKERYDRIYEKRSRFLAENDKRLEQVRQRYDDFLQEQRRKTDSRLQKNRRLAERASRADSHINRYRKRQDNRIRKRRANMRRLREEHEERVQQYFDDARTRAANRLKRSRAANYRRRCARRRRLLLTGGIGVGLICLLMELLVPGSFLKRREIIKDTSLESFLEPVGVMSYFLPPPKEYDVLVDMTEEQLLWELLLEHYNGNETAALGVMCNLYSESRFEAGNLEDYNNKLWSIADEDYTEKVNRKTIDKKDFLESRHIDSTNGYYNKDKQWVNMDGGYGYAQYTAYDKKEGLYQFAEQWFGPEGEGADYKFNIGDPKMQAHYVIHLLESRQYRKMDHLIGNAKTVVDACYYWLKMYEIPYDPYCDGYYTLAFERAACARDIEKACKGSE